MADGSTRDQLEFFRDLGVTEVYLDRAAAAKPAAIPGSMPDLPGLHRFLEGCPRCKLSKTRTNIVFGQGNAHAQLMFVGEAPGRDEDEQGLAFVGKAGQLLTRIIEAMGRKREDVFIANVLKCLAGDTPVHLGDGTRQPLRRLVHRRYDGPVMSVDSTGRVVPRRVTGWHASPLAGRRAVRLSLRSRGRRAPITLTGDHEVLTESGYVAAEMLSARHRIAVGVPGVGALEEETEIRALAAGESEVRSLRARWSIHRELQTIYDEAAVEDVTGRHRRDEFFYCLDVEGTHNFVTSGGVVHNCRPPNNRNPEADEVASCLPFLEEQIRLISPRVIVTLGTFAAQAVLRTD
ncbi:MAG TPA: uracil-DNA glycosylase family protein, partial [Thermoanaerobaculia bacterium]|nr:uracil-DNA glycosylase family protein [Thermoanaerobaculia bacterium]